MADHRALTAGSLLLALLCVPELRAQVVRRPPPALREDAAVIQLTLPATMRGGETASGSLTLPRSAPAGGFQVSLRSDHPDAASVDPVVTIPAFQRTAAFGVSAAARRGAPGVAVIITASGGGTAPSRGSRTITVVQAAALPTMSVTPPAVPVAAVSEPGRLAIESRLEPAPPVTDWQPRSQASTGSSIIITGSGFRPSDVSVRIGSRKLALVEATATRVVARAPSGTDPGVLDPHYAGPLTIGHAGGQLRTLAQTYRVVDRWDGYSPTVASVVRTAGLKLTDAVPRQWYARFEISLGGLPGDEVAGIAGAPVDAGCGQQIYVSAATHPVTDGKATIPVSMNFALAAVSCSSLRLPLRLRYRDQPDDVHDVVVNLGRVQLRTVIRVANTQQLVDAGVISFTAGRESGTCAGEVDGVRVGRLTIDGDAAFRVHDELAGSACGWRLNQSLESGKWILRDDGWTIQQFGWTNPTVSASRCRVQLEPKTGSEMGVFFFERGQVFMGRGARMMAPDSIMNVSLGCTSTAQQMVIIGIPPEAPHSVTAQLDWVELAAPLGSTRWQQLQE
jgi:hypothetical protein